MKSIKTFTEKKRSQKAILISAFIDELNNEETFWIPLSKISESDNEIQIDEEFWKIKLEELKAPKVVETIKISCKSYDQLEKATKVTIEVLFNEKLFDLFLFFPNSQIENMIHSEDEEKNNIYTITIAKWIWNSVFDKAIEKQLEYYNKDEVKYSSADFTLRNQLD